MENDATIQSAFQYPATPEPIAPDISAEADAAYASVLALREQLAEEIAQLLDDFSSEKGDALDELSQLIAEVDRILADTMKRAQESLDRDKDELAKTIASAWQTAAREIKSLREAAEAAKRELTGRIADLKAQGAEGRAAVEALREKLDKLFAEADEAMRKYFEQDTKTANDERTRRESQWDARMKEIAKKTVEAVAEASEAAEQAHDAGSDWDILWWIANPFIPISAIRAMVNNCIDVMMAFANADFVQHRHEVNARTWDFVNGGGDASRPGDIYRCTPEIALVMQTLACIGAESYGFAFNFARTGLSAAAEAALTDIMARRGAMQVSALDSVGKLCSRLGMICFVAGTPVVVDPGTALAASVLEPHPPEEPENSWRPYYWSLAGSALAAAILTYLLTEPARRRRNRLAAADALFTKDDLHLPLPSTPDGMPRFVSYSRRSETSAADAFWREFALEAKNAEAESPVDQNAEDARMTLKERA